MGSNVIKVQINSRTRKGRKVKPFGIMIVRVIDGATQHDKAQVGKLMQSALYEAKEGIQDSVLVVDEHVKSIQWIRLR